MSLGQFIGLLIIFIVIAGGAAYSGLKLKGSSSKKTRQAVFLTNGQVYFGYVSHSEAQYTLLKDIYYLQVQQPLQPPSGKDQQQPQISLVKLGNELHGPKDEMRINRDQILFFEDMKDDSKVNQAIADFIKNGGTSQASPTPQPTK